MERELGLAIPCIAEVERERMVGQPPGLKVRKDSSASEAELEGIHGVLTHSLT